MCGIIGEISCKNIQSIDWIKKAGSVINHRGPDNFGSWISQDNKVVFAHNRLSIIDLSSDGNQPMISNCKNFVITFNGEIYNYKKIKDELIANGLVFKTKTDTEVLLNSYKFWGLNIFDKIEGMFAFAIYDLTKKSVLLARDKSGEKPLYYFNNSKSLSFCSELKGLLKNSILERKLSINGLQHFLHQGYVSNNESLIEGVKKLRAGEYLNFNLLSGEILKKKYFNPPNINQINYSPVDEVEILKELNNLLSNSVKQQINADVPLGVLLSGGIDSSLIAGYASQSKKKINTFSFLNNLDNDDFELKNSRLVAKYFNTNHHEIFYPEIKTSIMDEISNYIDEPIFDSSIIPTYLINKEIKKYCTVVLSGDGGDELFGGYDHYPRILKLKKISKFFPNSFKKYISQFSSNFFPIGFRGRNWLKMLNKNFEKDYLDFAIYFDEINSSKIINQDIIDLKIKKNKLNRKTVVSNDIIYKSSIQDFNSFLSEDILSKNDRFSMASSVELRCPFLETTIINFAFSTLSSALKVNNNKKKIILKKLASKILPRDFILNKKRGFSIPINDYFKQRKWKTFAKEVLLDHSSLFNSSYTEKMLKKSFFNHNNSERLFGLIVFELWKKKNKVSIG